MTVNDLLGNFEIQGALKVQAWNNDDSPTVYYETDDHENALVHRGYNWLDREITYMFPITTYNRKGIEIPQIIVEVEGDN